MSPGNLKDGVSDKTLRSLCGALPATIAFARAVVKLAEDVWLEEREVDEIINAQIPGEDPDLALRLRELVDADLLPWLELSDV